MNLLTRSNVNTQDIAGTLKWRRRIRHSALIIGFISMGVACSGTTGDVENQEPESENEVQRLENQKAAQMMQTTLQQYVNASSRDEALKAQKAWIADLKKRYGGTIDASVTGPDATAHNARFSKLMREWNPLLCEAGELKSIVGKPTKETTIGEVRNKRNVIEYVFDNGSAAVTWKFTTSIGIIIGVEYLAHLPSTTDKQRQQPNDEKKTDAMNDPRQRYIDADTPEKLAEARKAWVSDLKSRYGGTIDPSLSDPDSRPHRLRFLKLMREWNPILCTVDELKAIAGKPSNERKKVNENSKEDTIMTYGFDTGLNYGETSFTASDGVIYKIEYHGGG